MRAVVHGGALALQAWDGTIKIVSPLEAVCERAAEVSDVQRGLHALPRPERRHAGPAGRALEADGEAGRDGDQQRRPDDGLAVQRDVDTTPDGKNKNKVEQRSSRDWPRSIGRMGIPHRLGAAGPLHRGRVAGVGYRYSYREHPDISYNKQIFNACRRVEIHDGMSAVR